MRDKKAHMKCETCATVYLLSELADGRCPQDGGACAETAEPLSPTLEEYGEDDVEPIEAARVLPKPEPEWELVASFCGIDRADAVVEIYEAPAPVRRGVYAPAHPFVAASNLWYSMIPEDDDEVDESARQHDVAVQGFHASVIALWRSGMRSGDRAIANAIDAFLTEMHYTD